MLVVVALMGLLMVFLIPAVSGIKGGRDLTGTAYDMQGFLDQARAYAMANNTYVFVGVEEVDSSKDPSATPQTAATGATACGRIAVAAVASKDGTRGSASTNLLAIGKLRRFENVHLASPSLSNPSSGNMARPSPNNNYYDIGDAACVSVATFGWPVGSSQYSFTKVIIFDPQGVARIQTASNTATSVPQVIEIGLIPTHGNTAPATTPANVAAIQIDGMTGATRVFRP